PRSGQKKAHRSSTGDPAAAVTRYAFARPASRVVADLSHSGSQSSRKGRLRPSVPVALQPFRYPPSMVSHNDSAAGLAMLAYGVSEGRFFALKPSDWSLLLGGVMLCGLLTLVFG